MSISEYLEWYILYIPKEIYGWGIISFLFVFLLMSLWRGFAGLRYGMLFLLIEYVALLVYFTVFMWRDSGQYHYRLIPFWSYQAIFQGTRVLAHEIAMNIAVFIPIGVLASLSLNKPSWKKVAIVGFVISFIIEFLQLVLKRGCCETDDVINNTLGCVIGFGIYLALRKVLNALYFSKK